MSELEPEKELISPLPPFQWRKQLTISVSSQTEKTRSAFDGTI
jgi:hypothetical protein